MAYSAAPLVQQLQRCPRPHPSPAIAARSSIAAFQTRGVHQQLEQHRLRCRGIEATPARFEDVSHHAYYERPVAGSKKSKVVQRVKEQRSRLRELSRQLPMEASASSLTAIVHELQAMSENLSDVSKVTACAFQLRCPVSKAFL